MWMKNSETGSRKIFEPICAKFSHILGGVSDVLTKRVTERLPDDGELIAAALKNDATAFSAIYLRYASQVAGIVYRLTGNERALDDIVQETFIDAFQYLDKVRDAERLKTWLIKIAVRKSKRYFAGRYRQEALARDYQLVFKESLSIPADISDAYDLLDRIPKKLRVPWALHCVEEMTLPEVAEICDRSLASVKRDIAKATEKIRRYLHDV